MAKEFKRPILNRLKKIRQDVLQTSTIFYRDFTQDELDKLSVIGSKLRKLIKKIEK